MHTIIYISEYQPAETSKGQVLKDIIQTAIQHNVRSDITGALIFYNNHFLQVLEGEQSNLKQLLAKIENDPRHKNLQVLYNQAIKQRSYPSWGMELFDLSDPSRFSKPILSKIKQLYDTNFQFNGSDFVFLIKELLNDTEFLAALDK